MSRTVRKRWTLLGVAGAGAVTLALFAVAALTSGSAQAQAQAVAPANTATPVISGIASLGETLTADSGSWTGDPTITFTYQWRRCNSGGATCADISGAAGSTHAVVSADVGSTLRIQVTATNGAGSAMAQSDATAVVAPSSAPVNTAQPTISGTLAQDSTLTGTLGTWTGSQPIGYVYQWVRCAADGGSADGSTCATIAGATGLTYVLQSDDMDHPIRFRVTATNSIGTRTAASNATAAVGPPPSTSAPKNTKAPAISGTAKQGQTLTASTGAWTGAAPITYSYQWLRCDANGNGCVLFIGQTKATYALGSSEVSSRLRVRVTATNSKGSAGTTSSATAAVQAGTAAAPPAPGPLPAGAIKLPNGKYSIPITSVSLPARLIVDAVRFSPNPVRSRRAMVVLRVHVVDTRGYVIRGALIFARSTPLVTTSMANQATGQDGWVTLRLAPKSDFPLRKGHNVQFFIRAGKAGDDVLAGVSTRRLVQVATMR